MRKAISPLVVLLGSLGMEAGAFGQQGKITARIVPRGERPNLAVAPGWSWLLDPQDFQVGRVWGGARERGAILTGYSVADAEGSLRLFFIQSGPGIIDSPRFRLVVFDAEGNRYLPKREDGGGMKNLDTEVRHSAFLLDPGEVAPDKVAYIGVEYIEPNQE